MPCASVSEKPTRVKAEYLKGGLRSVTRPSSSAIRPNAKRRRRERAGGRNVEPASTDPADHTPAGEPRQQEPDHRKGDKDVVAADLSPARPCPLVRSVIGLGARVRCEVLRRLHDCRLT